MEENTIFHDRYQLIKLLGRGAYSEVWLVTDIKTQSECALKIFAPSTGLDDYGLNMFAREFSLVTAVSGNYILKPLHYDVCDRKPYLVLPFCQNGSVKTKINNVTEEDAWQIMNDVAHGLKSLHEMTPPIIHQDIKPDNIMISNDGHYMITDFGVSTRIHSTLRKSVIEYNNAGTLAYMAPERFGRNKMPIMASDIYSLGATIYELLTGDTPFGNDGGLIQKAGADIPELYGDYSDNLQNVVDKCLALESWDRPSAEQLIELIAARKNTAPSDQGDTPIGSGEGPIEVPGEKGISWATYLTVILAGLIVGVCMAYFVL